MMVIVQTSIANMNYNKMYPQEIKHWTTVWCYYLLYCWFSSQGKWVLCRDICSSLCITLLMKATICNQGTCPSTENSEELWETNWMTNWMTTHGHIWRRALCGGIALAISHGPLLFIWCISVDLIGELREWWRSTSCWVSDATRNHLRLASLLTLWAVGL